MSNTPFRIENKKGKCKRIAYNKSVLILLILGLMLITPNFKIESVEKSDTDYCLYAGISKVLNQNIKSAEKVSTIKKENEIVFQPEVSLYEQRSIPDEIEYISDDDAYLLAKIAMAETEGQSRFAKAMVIRVVLNRVESDQFPDTIYDVIFEKNQFTPVSDGRWDEVEPDEECYLAVRLVMRNTAQDYDISNGALYFEACDSEDNWHNKHLTKVAESDGGIRFYK